MDSQNTDNFGNSNQQPQMAPVPSSYPQHIRFSDNGTPIVAPVQSPSNVEHPFVPGGTVHQDVTSLFDSPPSSQLQQSQAPSQASAAATFFDNGQPVAQPHGQTQPMDPQQTAHVLNILAPFIAQGYQQFQNVQSQHASQVAVTSQSPFQASQHANMSTPDRYGPTPDSGVSPNPPTLVDASAQRPSSPFGSTHMFHTPIAVNAGQSQAQA